MTNRSEPVLPSEIQGPDPPVSKHVKHVPKHRATRPSRGPALAAVPGRALRHTVLLSSVAVAATGVAVAGGVLDAPVSIGRAAENANDDLGGVGKPGVVAAAAADVDRRPVVSRSDRRTGPDPRKAAALGSDPLGSDQPSALTRTESALDDDPRSIGRALLAEFGFSSDQFSCLDALWTRESNWRVNADNPTSSAYGIPQALPGERMADAGADWATNPITQIRWGLGYIADRYGSPCGAWGFSQANGWY